MIYKNVISSHVNLNTPRVINPLKTVEYTKRLKDNARIKLPKLSQTTMKITVANKTNGICGTSYKNETLIIPYSHTTIQWCIASL